MLSCFAVLIPFRGVLFVCSKEECQEWQHCNIDTSHGTRQAINERMIDAPKSILKSVEGIFSPSADSDSGFIPQQEVLQIMVDIKL